MSDDRRGASYAKHERLQRHPGLLLTHRERLEWLERAKAFAAKAQGAAQTAPPTDEPQGRR